MSLATDFLAAQLKPFRAGPPWMNSCLKADVKWVSLQGRAIGWEGHYPGQQRRPHKVDSSPEAGFAHVRWSSRNYASLDSESFLCIHVSPSKRAFDISAREPPLSFYQSVPTHEMLRLKLPLSSSSQGLEHIYWVKILRHRFGGKAAHQSRALTES